VLRLLLPPGAGAKAGARWPGLRQGAPRPGGFLPRPPALIARGTMRTFASTGEHKMEIATLDSITRVGYVCPAAYY